MKIDMKDGRWKPCLATKEEIARGKEAYKRMLEAFALDALNKKPRMLPDRNILLD